MKISRIVATRLPTPFAEFTIHGFREEATGQEHVVLTLGDIAQGSADEPPLVRVHSECLTGEVFGSLRCDCRPQLEAAMQRVADEGRGAIVYMRGHEGRGIGLVQKLRAYAEQDAGADTIEANEMLGLPIDARRYDAAVCMLRHLGVQRLRLLTNNPLKVAALQDLGLEVVARESVLTAPGPDNERYLRTKADQMGHRDLGHLFD
ncbi:GTP cyclohydrolase II [Roseateles paludis]|jgi:GTP cyclohydrolase II|uniref:GTP cyclohydrolase-2 n=1 Tax=Roseateles paludis TaxID=3145238 RepID=A0ABV0FXQ1_9BURK